jgi:LysM repeat protein
VVKKFILAFIIGFFILGLVGCADNSSQADDTPSATVGQITPYRTATQPIRTLAVTQAPTPTPPPLPTPTPFMYTVVQNDTMLAIASRFGITLDELQVANPEVSPNFLSIGTQLVIPLKFHEEETAAEQLLPIEEGEIECFQVRSGGLWCYWLVGNPLDHPVENITAIIRLYDGLGQQVASKTAVPLLNILESGAQTPITAFFEPPVPPWQLAQGQLQSVVAANQFSERYISGSFEGLNISISQEGLQAGISGMLRLTTEQLPEYVWVLAVAYDSEDAVVGVRRWEASEDQLAENTPAFSFQVYSLGRPIDHVDMLFEARALPAPGPEN